MLNICIMIEDLKSLLLFAKTVESGSFRAAARSLGISPSVVSYQVSQIEKRYGVALLYRSTRKLSLTDNGTRLLEHAKQMIEATERGLDLLSGKALQPVGKLTISLPAAFARSPLVTTISEFAQLNPKVEFSIGFSDIQKDLIAEGIDLAIRSGEMEDSSLVAKKIQIIPRKLVASPAYLKDRDFPESPRDVEQMEWIRLTMLPARRKFIQGTSKTHTVDYDHRISVNNVDGMCQLVKSGLGLATLPYFLAEEEIKAGRLVELIPDWQVEPLEVFAVWPPNAPRESLTRRLLDFLSQNLH